jgi:hypothetical protein
MSSVRDDLYGELHAERKLSTSEIWRAAEARLDWPIEGGLNTAHECAATGWSRMRSISFAPNRSGNCVTRPHTTNHPQRSGCRYPESRRCRGVFTQRRDDGGWT